MAEHLPRLCGTLGLIIERKRPSGGWMLRLTERLFAVVLWFQCRGLDLRSHVLRKTHGCKHMELNSLSLSLCYQAGPEHVGMDPGLQSGRCASRSFSLNICTQTHFFFVLCVSIGSVLVKVQVLDQRHMS